MLVGRRWRPVLRQYIDDRLMAAIGQADMQFATERQLAHVAAAGAGGADTGEIDRAVADVVVAVAAEILGWELPVARDQPFLDAAQHLGLTLAAVPAVEDQIEIAGETAEIFEKGRRLRIPGGPHRALVAAELRHLDETPLRAIELRVVGLAEIRDADQPAVGAVAPAVVGAGEDRRVALVVAAHLHAAVPAGIEKDMHLAGPVAAQDHALLAHAGDKEIAGVRDLALMPDKEPGAGKEPLLLLRVDLLVDEDLAADLASVQIDETLAIPRCRRARHRRPPLCSSHVMAAVAPTPARRCVRARRSV